MKIKSLILLLSFFLIANAQQETLLDGDVTFGGFGGPVVKFSAINGKFAVFPGGRGAAIINHQFTFGGAGYGLANYIEAKKPYKQTDIKQYYELGYGGIDLGFFFNPDKLINFYFHTLIGAGSVMYKLHNPNNYSDVDKYTTNFFALEPEAEVVLNVTKWMKVSAGVSYRILGGFEFDGLKNTDFMFPAAHLAFSFGAF